MMTSVPSRRGGRVVGVLVTLALLTFSVFIPSAAQAAAPANDEIGAATAIGSLPFSDALDTSEATTAADDPFCAGNGHTVWYTFTPSADIRLDANTFGSSHDTTISMYTGSPGALTQIACNDDSGSLQSQVVIDATGGETYYIMAGSFFSGSGGNLTLTLREAPPPPPAPEIGLSVDRGGSVDGNGLATVGGTVTCNQPMFVSLFGSLTQTFARRLTIQGFGGSFVSCTPPSVPWKLTVFAFSNRFGPGPAQASISGFACNNVGCASDQRTAAVTLRGGRPQ